MLQLLCTREAGCIYEAGGLTSVISFIQNYSNRIHADTRYSALDLISKLCAKIEPSDAQLSSIVASLSSLLSHHSREVSEGVLKCHASMIHRFSRREVDLSPFASPELLDHLLERLKPALPALEASGTAPASQPQDTLNSSGSGSGAWASAGQAVFAAVDGSPRTVAGLLQCLCRNSREVKRLAERGFKGARGSEAIFFMLMLASAV